MLKRVLKVVGGLLLALVLAVAWIGYVTFGHSKPMVDGEQVGPAKSLKLGMVQAFVLDAGGGQVVLVDTGTDAKAEALQAELKRRGATVKAIFLTHGDGDHTGGVPAFPQAEVYAGAAELDLIAGKVSKGAPASKLFHIAPVKLTVTHPLHDGETVQVGKLSVKCFDVPGHTPGSVAYLIDGVLFLGDSANAEKDGEVAPAPWFFTGDTDQNHRALVRLVEQLKSEDVKLLAFGHSGSVQGVEPLRRLAAKLAR